MIKVRHKHNRKRVNLMDIMGRKVIEITLNKKQQEQVQRFVDYMNTEGRCDPELDPVWTVELAVNVLFQNGLKEALKHR